MKQIFASALLLTCLVLPASASSIVEIDTMVTGPQGRSSIVTLGGDAPCAEAACVDATGGDNDLMTSSFAQIASITAQANKKINFEFARRFPDPAVPVPTTVPEDSGLTSGGAIGYPEASPDGTIATQPPVEPQPEPSLIGAPVDGAPVDATRGSIDPNAPTMPVVNSELREGE